MRDALLSPADEERLLGRPVRPLLTPADRRALAGRRYLVTGAGGSIGAEIARQLASCAPAALALLDHSERQLFEIEREIAERWPDVPIEPLLVDVSRPSAMRQACRRSRPHAVFHAAAYKHVAMAERAVCAAARVNVLGTAIALEASRAAGARFMLISSDKAAEPRSVMGATKRFAELLTIAAAGPGFRTTVVRFGNVLASSGSFVTIAQDCIRRGRPIPLTDPDATRYFMTLSEAASLVLKADALPAAGGQTFWLDMGEPIRMGDLVDRLIALGVRAGYAPVPVRVIGLRPGEKRDEQLAGGGLTMRRTSDPRIWVARQKPIARASMAAALDELQRHVEEADALAALRTLRAAVPEYAPSEHAWAAARDEGQMADESLLARRLTA